MKLSFFIAKRYLFSRKSRSIINAISIISGTVIAVVTAALLVVLSVFNGIEDLVGSLLGSAQPDVRIELHSGRTFEPDQNIYQVLENNSEVADYSVLLKGEVLLQFGENQEVATLMGVDDKYGDLIGISERIVDGEFPKEISNSSEVVIGAGLHHYLEIPDIERLYETLHLYSIPRGSNIKKQRLSALQNNLANVSGVFSVNAEYDLSLVFSSLHFAEKALGKKGEISSVEVVVNNEEEAGVVKSQLREALGKEYLIRTKRELNTIFYQTSKTEKIVTFFILLFIVIIAAFNVLASLTMLVYDKKNDIKIMEILGFTRAAVVRIFFIQSLLICGLGLLIGLVFGTTLVFLQEQFSLVKFTGTVVEAYPVKMLFSDFIWVTLAVGVISILSYFPVRYLMNRALGKEV